MKMEHILLVLPLLCGLSSCEAVRGENHVTCQAEAVETEEGEDVTLQFCIQPPVDLTDYNLDITRTDLKDDRHYVHSYSDGKDNVDPQMKQYEHRTTLIHDDLVRGEVTIRISSVQLNDTGSYGLYIKDLVSGDCVIILTVVKKGQRILTTTKPSSPPVSHDDGEVNVGAVVGGVVGGVVSVLFLFVLVGVLVKCGLIKSCVKKPRGERRQELVMAAEEGAALKNPEETKENSL